MKEADQNPISKINDIAPFIFELRHQKVILDSDVAAIYGVETRDINKSVKNNLDKFPEGYVLELNSKEKQEVVENFHHLEKLKFSPTLPKALTEKGLYMLPSILKSKQATLPIIETFAKVRAFSKVAKSIALEKNKTKQNPLIKKSGALIADILNQEFAQDTSSETTIELDLAMIKVKHTHEKRK